MRIFKFDVRTEALLRNEKTGRCIECGAGEAGELLGECGVVYVCTQCCTYSKQVCC